ncbi:MAG: RNA methyltransferase [Simkaniaceae bacterium]|nr:RNA methyltransferase [Simkaniaceae bacterium]
MKIESIDDPRIRPYLSLRVRLTHHLEEEEGEVFVAESEKVVEELFRSDFEVVSFFALPHYVQKFQPKVPTYTAEPELMQKIVGFKMHQGVMALVRKPRQKPLSSGPAVVLNGLANAENVGAIVRNCAAFGVKNLIVDEKCSSPYLRRSVKVSRGAIFHINVFETADLKTTLIEGGYTILGADANPQAVPLKELKSITNYALIMGSEGAGMQSEIKELCHQLVTIPMQGGIDSLNASVANAVLLYALQGD